MEQTVGMRRKSIYRGYRFPPDVIAYAVWLYHRFSLSLRDIEDLLAERGVTLSYETIRLAWPIVGRTVNARVCEFAHQEPGARSGNCAC